jgi:hypothetical protein
MPTTITHTVMRSICGTKIGRKATKAMKVASAITFRTMSSNRHLLSFQRANQPPRRAEEACILAALADELYADG